MSEREQDIAEPVEIEEAIASEPLHDEDDRLSPEFVDKVVAAVEAGTSMPPARWSSRFTLRTSPICSSSRPIISASRSPPRSPSCSTVTCSPR